MLFANYKNAEQCYNTNLLDNGNFQDEISNVRSIRFILRRKKNGAYLTTGDYSYSTPHFSIFQYIRNISENKLNYSVKVRTPTI